MNDAMRSILSHMEPEEIPDTVERVMCQYKEYVGEIGEWMACGLAEHGPRIKHGNWKRV